MTPTLVYVRTGGRRLTALLIRETAETAWVFARGQLLEVPIRDVSRRRPLRGAQAGKLLAEWERIQILRRGLGPHSTGRDLRGVRP